LTINFNVGFLFSVRLAFQVDFAWVANTTQQTNLLTAQSKKNFSACAEAVIKKEQRLKKLQRQLKSSHHRTAALYVLGNKNM